MPETKILDFTEPITNILDLKEPRKQYFRFYWTVLDFTDQVTNILHFTETVTNI